MAGAAKTLGHTCSLVLLCGCTGSELCEGALLRDGLGAQLCGDKDELLCTDADAWLVGGKGALLCDGTGTLLCDMGVILLCAWV